MKVHEFEEWLAKHIDAYPGLAAWLQAHPAQVDIWRDTLSDVRHPDAIAATRQLVCGLVPQPTGWTNHPRAVRQIAQQIAYDTSPDRFVQALPPEPEPTKEERDNKHAEWRAMVKDVWPSFEFQTGLLGEE